MTNKMPKPVYQIFLGLFMLAFTVIACKDKKDGDKKDAPVTDTTAVKPAMDQPMPADTNKMDSKDTIKTKPVQDPVKVPPAPTN